MQKFTDLFGKEAESKYSKLCGHMVVSFATAQLFHCSMKAIIDNTGSSISGCVPIKLYLQEQAADRVWLMSCLQASCPTS